MNPTLQDTTGGQSWSSFLQGALNSLASYQLQVKQMELNNQQNAVTTYTPQGVYTNGTTTPTVSSTIGSTLGSMGPVLIVAGLALVVFMLVKK